MEISVTCFTCSVKSVVLCLFALHAAPALAQTPPDAVEAPIYRAGDTWTWVSTIKPRDTCTISFQNGSKTTQTIESVTDKGYTAVFTGPAAGQTFNRSYYKDLSYDGEVDGTAIKTNTFNFPLRDGNSWETTLRGVFVVTKLTCKSTAVETLKIAGEDLQTTPISCTGRWRNLNSNNTDQAIYKYWYSPKIGNMVRASVFTYSRGGTCADAELQLESYKLAN